MTVKLTFIYIDDKGERHFLKFGFDFDYVAGIGENVDKETEIYDLNFKHIGTVAEAFDTVYAIFQKSREVEHE